MVNTRQSEASTVPTQRTTSSASTSGSQTVTTEWRPAIPPEFAGRIHQDPKQFLEQFKKYAQEAAIPVDSWVRTAEQQLRETALTNYQEDYGRDAEYTWAEFQAYIEDRYDDYRTRNTARELLYASDQKGENARRFIRQKQLLARRICPEAPVGELVEMVIDQLHPDLRFGVRVRNPRTWEELTSAADALDRDLRHQRQRAAPTPAPRTATPAPRTAAPAPARPQPAAGSRPQRDRQPPLCAFCPGRHWHRDCPERQGNGPRAEPRA